MFTIKDEGFVYIPIQYALTWDGKIKGGTSISITKKQIDTLGDYCNQVGNFIWDFRNIKHINDRDFSDVFKNLKQHRRTIIITNVETESSIEKAIRDGIKQKQIQEMTCLNEIHKYYFIGEQVDEGFNEFTIDKIHKNYLKELIDENCIVEKPQYLVSSGVYSNMQINLKNLFTDVTSFSYIIYLLWDQICNIQIDGLIATSKNGVAFASILGEMLGLPVLYYNIGQMFEEIYNCSPMIKRDGKYIHVYDMICLGSETKILNALVNAQGGIILNSIGCICLLDLEIVKIKNRYSAMNHVWCLLGQKDLKRKYTIYLDNLWEKSNEN